jgi:hypothetical protein
MASSVCNTRCDKTFFLRDSTAPILDMSTQSVPRRCAKHILPQVTNRRRHASPNKRKTKVTNKESYMTHRTQQGSW